MRQSFRCLCHSRPSCRILCYGRCPSLLLGCSWLTLLTGEFSCQLFLRPFHGLNRSSVVSESFLFLGNSLKWLFEQLSWMCTFFSFEGVVLLPKTALCLCWPSFLAVSFHRPSRL